MKRTHLPLNALRVFDAAARHLNFTRAADELAVTPAAVGQQIRALEDVLGVVLFRRTPKGLELTPEATNGLDALRSGFLSFEEAVAAMRVGQSSNTLAIAAPREIIARWLLPRLAPIAAQQPALRFRLITADDPIDFTEANLDLAIRRLDSKGDLEGVAIDDGTAVDIAPAEGDGPFSVCWGESTVESQQGALHVADAGMAIDAVSQGLGRARVPAVLTLDAVDGAPYRITGRHQPGGRAYWLVAPAPQWRQPKVRSLVQWLTDGMDERG